MRVRNISVHKLFGRFDHSIPLNRDERITIIHGPNGYGKTALLKLVYALFSHDQDVLKNTPFESLRVDLEGGLSIVLRRSLLPTSDQPSALRALTEYPHGNPKLVYSVLGNGKELLTYTATVHFFKGSQEFSRPKDWPSVVFHAMEQSFDEVMESAEPAGSESGIEVNWGSDWCTRTLTRLQGTFDNPDGFFLYLFLRTMVRTHLVSIQRLFVRRDPDPERQDLHRLLGGATDDDEITFKSAATTFSKEFRDLVQAAQSEYTEKTQKLDRTFPQRVMAASQENPGSDEDLKRELAELEARRSHLMTLGLLPGDDTALQPPADSFDDSTRKVLWIYVDDNKEKLAVLDELARKVDLLQGLINKRFQFKRLKIDVKRGFLFESTEGEELEPTALSSGEQHELIMVYECLFRLQKDSLLLIDEPELSLHVAWQVEFLRDLLRIIKISQIDVLIATHSPQIIHDRWDLTVELKPPPADQSAA